MLINPLLPDQMNIFGNEFCIFPQSIFVVLNSVSFHLISKGHPYQGLECWVEAYDFFNVFFFSLFYELAINHPFSYVLWGSWKWF